MVISDDRVREAREAVAGAAHGEAGPALEELQKTWADRYGLKISRSHLYALTRDLRSERKRRSDAGITRSTSPPPDQVEYMRIIAVKLAKSNGPKRPPAAQDILDMARGHFDGRFVAISPARLSALLRREHHSVRELRRPAPTARIEHAHSNDQWVYDQTVFQFYFRPGDAALAHPEAWLNKNRDAQGKRAIQISVHSVVDSHSRRRRMYAYFGAVNAWQVKHHLVETMKGWGIPRTIYSDKHGAYTDEIAGLLRDLGVIWIGRRKGAPGPWKRGKVENPFRHLNRAQEFSRLCPWESLDQINDWITARDARYCRAHRCASTGEIPEARWMRGLRPNARTMPVDEICKKMFRVPYERTVSRYTIHIPGEQIWLPHGVDAFRRMEGKRVMLYLLPWNNEVAIVRDSDGKEYELPRQSQPASAGEGLKPRALGAWEIEVNRLANADVPIARPKIVVPPPIAAGLAAPSVQKELVAKRPELDGPAPEKIIPVEHLRESLREGGLISRPITEAENAVINQHLLAGGGIRAADVSQIESELTALQAKSRVA